MKQTGVTARGIKTPIFREGDDLVASVSESILKAAAGEGFALSDGDVVGVTEAVVARTQGNYATCAQIAAAVRQKLGGETLGLVFPIMSRNRFAILLKAFAMSAKKLIIQFSYPADEVGNLLVDRDRFDESGIDPYAKIGRASCRERV